MIDRRDILKGAGAALTTSLVTARANGAKEEAAMTDIPVFMIANLVVQDAAEYRKYEKGFFPLLKRYGGEFITFDDKPHTFEGASPRPGRVIIFKFPSEEKAQQWYADPEYQALSEHRRAGTKLEFLTMVHGMASRT